MSPSRLLTAVLAAGILGAAATGAAPGGNAPEPRMIVIGFDGMDPRIVRGMWKDGKLPNLKKLAETGGFSPLWSSIPPQSPVAWSNFITGMNPGGHGIFDFIHRRTDTYQPYLSMSETMAPEGLTVPLGKYSIPLSGGEVVLLRRGKAFWEYLEDAGIPATVFKMPSNFPPAGKKARSVSGMGTPDLLGTYGTYQYFTTDPADIPADYGGARMELVFPEGDRIDQALEGPPDNYLEGNPRIMIPFTVWIDPVNPVARIDIQDRRLMLPQGDWVPEDRLGPREGEEPAQRILLQQGEWSDWVTVEFDPLPLPSIPGLYRPPTGICRFYLKEVHPEFKLYVSPINIDPRNPALPIDLPRGFAAEIAEAAGDFYTQGMPEETKALDNGTFTTEEFYRQSMMVLHERLRLFDYLFDRFDKGFFFFYFSSTDQNSHIFWHLRDPHHPIHDPVMRAKLGDVIEEIYGEMDKVVGKILRRLDENTTLVIMSDHGFGPFYRNFHLNTWLKENGYLTAAPGGGIDWKRSRVYALGLNGLYLNLRGRESQGTVNPGPEADALKRELKEKLEAVTDPENGKSVIKKVHIAAEVYSGENVDQAPDLLVGYDWGYRTGYQSALGMVTNDILTTSTEKWSGDHCGATEIVPGILFSNRPILNLNPHLYDITPAILETFGIPVPETMVGTSIFRPAPPAPTAAGADLPYL